MAEIEYLGPLEAGNSGAPDNGGVEYLGPLADDSSIGGELIKGAKAGWLGANKAVGSVLEYTGELTGSDTIENIGKTTSDYWGGKLKKETPAVANMTDINSAGDFAKWAAWNVGQMGSQMAVTAPFMLMGGGGAVGTATGFQAIKSLVTRAPGAAGQFGRFLGQWAKLKPMDIPIGIMEGGQIAEGQLEELKSGKTKELSPIRGLAAAFVATKLEELGAEGALNRLMQGAGIKKGSLLRRIGQNALATGAGEGTEEFFQSYAEQVGIDPTDITSYDQFKNAVNGAAAGFVGGFFMGGGTGAVAKQTEQNDTPQNDLPIPDTKITRDDVSVDQAIQETAADVFTEETKSNMLGKLLKKTGEAGLDNNKASSPNTASTQYDDIIQTNADQYGVDPSLIKAVIQAESNFKNGRTSPAGAAGLMQLMPGTAKEMGVNDVMNPEQNIAGGVKYLAGLLQRYGGDEAAALAAYNWGPGNLSKYGIENAPKETQNYINKILSNKSSFGLSSVEQNISSELDIPTYLRDLKQLPPGQGFTFKDVDYGIPIGEPYSQEEPAVVRSKTTPIEGLPQPEERLQLPPGQGFDLVDKAEPDIVAPQKEKVATVRQRLLDEKQLRSARKILPYYPARKLSDNDVSILRTARDQGRLDNDEKKVLASIEADNFSKIQKSPKAAQASPTNLSGAGEIVQSGASSQEIAETRTGKGFAEGKTKEPFMPQTVPAKTKIKQATVRAKGAQNLVTKVLELGGLRVSGKDYVTRLLRQDSDAKRVLRMKDGLTADQLASRLQAEGWQIDSGDHLVELLKSGDARSIYAPEIVDDKLNRQAEREANEWAEQQVRELEAAKQRLVAEGIDTGRIEASSERIISDLQELAEAEEIETNTAEIGDFFDDIIASRKEQPQKEVVSQEEIPKGEFQNAELPGATAAETFTLSNPETEMSQHKPLSEQATVKNEEIPFNRKDTGKEMPSRGITTVRVQPIVDKVTSTLNINPKINVIQHVSECPKAVLKNMEERGILDENGDADVQGFAWNGETWLVADNLDTQKEVFQVLMHELTHNGLGALLKDQAGLKTVRWQYNKLMDKIIAAHRQDIMTIAQTTHTHLNLNTIEGRRQAAEEWLCNQSYEAQYKWYDKLVTIFHNFIRALGVDIKLADAEVRTILREAFQTFEVRDNEVRYMTAWHGSPYSFERFSNKHIGTPEEGVQYARKSQGLPNETDNLTSSLSSGQKIARLWQDHMKAFDVVRDALRKTGKVMSDLTDVSRFETLARSKTANGITRFMSHTIDPLVKDIAESRWTMEDVQDYAMMRHVPEANEYLAKLHNDPSVTANGVTTEEAEAKLAGYEANPNFNELKDFADRLNQISDDSLEILVKCGRISEDSRNAMKSAYQFYVPLRGGDVSEKTGKGMTVGGKIMRRKGHETRQEFILENIIKQRENAIRQANKNEAALSVTEFIMEADNPEIGTVGKPQKHAVFKHKTVYGVESKEGAMIAAFTSEADAWRFIAQQKLTGHADVVETKEPSVVMQARPLLEDNEIAAYIDGYQIRVQLNHEGLARAATNTDVEQLNTILSVSKSFNRYLTSVYTQYNPEFAARNIIRDFSAGLVNLTGDYGASIAAKTIANYPRAIQELFKSRHDYLKSKYVKEYGEDGGQIGAAWLPSLEKVSSDLEKSYLEYLGVSKAFNHSYDKALNEGHSEQKAYLTAIRKVGIASVKKIPLIGHFLKLVDRVNMLSENAFRLATYMTLRENGAGRAEAAEASKDVTLNFDRHGELSNQAGALYLFFNPAVQGINRSFFALTQSKHKHQAQALTAMMIGAGYMLAGLCDKDEWDKINRGIKSRSLIVSIGEKQFITIPLSYEYGVFTAIGYAIMDVLRGSRKPTEAALDVATATINALSPFGNPMDDRGNITAFQVLPTTAKIILAPTINQNTFGAPLMPQKYSESKPDSALMWRSTVGSQYDKISAFLNEATGGTRYTKGAMDISPETMKFFVNTLTGGTGTFISKLVNLSSIVGQGATPEKREIPFVSSFVRDITPQESRTRFWEKAEEVKAAATAFSQAKKKGDREAMLQIRQDFGPLLTLAKFANETSKLAKVKRDAIESIRLDENISLEQKRAHMRKLELQEEAAYDTFLKVFEIRSIN